MPAVEQVTPSLLSRMEHYRLSSRRAALAPGGGPRRSRLKGGAVEFADYREYTPGDEPRRVDWKAYARLRRLYVKEFLDEREDSVLFLIDTSASMDFGTVDHKGRFALQLAAGLGCSALAGQESLAVAVAPDTGREGERARVLRPLRGRQALPRLLTFLAGLSFAGQADLAASLQVALQLLPRVRRLYVFSDFLCPEGCEPLLQRATAAGLEVYLLHILAPSELNPAMEGDLAFIDAETGARVEVTITPAVLATYRRRLEDYFAFLDASCHRRGARRVLLESGAGAATALQQTLVRAGLLLLRGYIGRRRYPF
ncbi:MAG: hypothetical protein PWQ18_30 [Clostridia bacterium]|nr:hypothetical protein [Clostridia bacterium]